MCSKMSMAEIIERKLQDDLMPVELEVVDESHKHAGHEGVKGYDGATHFKVKIISDNFIGKSLLERHRLVYKVLDEEIKTSIHALAINAMTREEDSKRKIR